jgi:hypothetical protein
VWGASEGSTETLRAGPPRERSGSAAGTFRLAAAPGAPPGRAPAARRNVTTNGHRTLRVTLTTVSGVNATSDFVGKTRVTLRSVSVVNVTSDRTPASTVTL